MNKIKQFINKIFCNHDWIISEQLNHVHRIERCNKCGKEQVIKNERL